MKFKTVFFIMGIFTVFSLQAGNLPLNAHDANCVVVNGINKCRLSGKGIMQLANTSQLSNAKNIFMQLNDRRIKGDLKLYQTHGQKGNFIKGEFLLDNISGNKTYIQYKVIFKDKKGAIAQTSGDIHLPQGKSHTKKIGSIPLGKADVNSIKSYEIIMTSSNIKLHRH